MAKSQLSLLRQKLGYKVGNGQCYGLVSYYATLFPSYPRMGAGIQSSPFDAVGDALNAYNIGNAFDWPKFGWSVKTAITPQDLKAGAIINIKPHYGWLWETGQYGHTAIIEEVAPDFVVIIQQNYAGRQYATREKYPNNSLLLSSISSLVYPPVEQRNRAPQGEHNLFTLKPETGTFTTSVGGLNVREYPRPSGPVLAVYNKGDKIHYDSYCISEGYVWISYIGQSGNRRYVACGLEKDGLNIHPYGTFS